MDCMRVRYGNASPNAAGLPRLSSNPFRRDGDGTGIDLTGHVVFRISLHSGLREDEGDITHRAIDPCLPRNSI